MKKISLLLAALALVLGTSQCSKENEPAQSGGRQHIVLNASFDDGNSKIADDNNGGLKWSVGDQIDVFQNNGNIGSLECTDAESGTFEGDIEPDTGDAITFTFGAQNFDNQTGNLNDAIYLTSGEVAYVEGGNYGTVSMTMPHAVLKLDLSGFGTSGGTTVTISDGTNTASVAGVTAASTAVYVAVPAESPEEATEKTYMFKGNGLIAKKNWTLAANTFYSAMGPESNPTGNAFVIEVVVPKFSVSETTTVEFASGNLWYNTDEGKFYFESNQWSFAKSWDAKHVSHFFWGKTALIAYAQTYNDGNASTDDIFFTNQEGFMVNGEMGWRTLSSDEWIYLTGVSGRPGLGGHAQNARINAENLYAWKTLDDGAYLGWIILPDGTDYEIAFGDGDWAISSVLDLDFYGAIFLPAAGYRNDTRIENDDNGYYWSSTPYPISDRGYSFSIKSGESSVDSRYRNRGSSVRLVR